ncbi:MAG: Gfo/Idh/MocA family oxidoreductase, partial [Lentisphaerae bacterium]|nr:Gfo/Idh/MocA family oxidoreductase [Lentisphaerota bacterium]
MPKIAVISVAHIHSRQFCDKISKSTSGKAPCLIWDENVERGTKYASDYNSRFEPDLAKAVSDPEVDAFIVCAENTRHLPLLQKILPMGKPVMCEKPLATKASEADEIVALARKYNVKLICGYHLPFNGANRAAKEHIVNKELGDVTHVNFRNAHHAAYGRWFDNPELAWFTEPELSGGGALLDMGTHAVQFLRHLAGPVEKVWAEILNLSNVYPKVDDYGLIVMKFKSGIIGRAEAGWVFT